MPTGLAVALLVMVPVAAALTLPERAKVALWPAPSGTPVQAPVAES
jgi:hypothetical protein